MSAIAPSNVTRVLLPDGWYDVLPGTFKFDHYCWSAEYDWNTTPLGPDQASLGFTFQIKQGSHLRITGPVSSIKAVAQEDQ